MKIFAGLQFHFINPNKDPKISKYFGSIIIEIPKNIINIEEISIPSTPSIKPLAFVSHSWVLDVQDEIIIIDNI